MSVQEIAHKRGMSVESLRAGQAQLTKQAKEAGLDLHFDTIINGNTFDSHRLGHYAVAQGKGAEMTERLLRAYLSDSLDIADPSVLVSLAGELGLDEAATAAMLESDAYRAQVKADIAEGTRLGITGVPFFVFNNKYAISGAQPLQVFSEVLSTVRAEERETQNLKLLNPSSGDNN